MKVLSNRTKIAAAINFSQYPVIRIDLSKTDLYGVVGAPVRIDNGTFTTGEPYFVRGYLRTFKDENVLTFDAGGVALKANLSYSDYERMLEYTNAPIVKPDQDILVCMVDSERRLVYDPVVLRTGPRSIWSGARFRLRRRWSAMPKYPKGHKDVVFFAPKSKRGSRPIAGSTTATNDFLVLVHETYPEATISRLKELLTDRSKFILNPEAVAVLDAYITRGYGDFVPEWR